MQARSNIIAHIPILMMLILKNVYDMGNIDKNVPDREFIIMKPIPICLIENTLYRYSITLTTQNTNIEITTTTVTKNARMNPKYTWIH